MPTEKAVIDSMGGGEKISKNTKVYKLNNGEVILIKSSSKVRNKDHYMYGIRPHTLEENNLDSIVLVFGSEGFVKIPFIIFYNE